MVKLIGLTNEEVAERTASGQVNRTADDSSRTIRDILQSNILTPFNALITFLAVVVWLVGGSPINSLFFIAMLLNIIIGVIQELRAKAVLDKLAIVVKPKVTVIRNGEETIIDSADVVVDDLIKLEMGDQVVVDGEIVNSSGIEINESLLTGEADDIVKAVGDKVLSGSFVVAGNGVIRATNVGERSYSAKLTKEARRFKRASSELIDATNTIMKWIAKIMLVVAPILIIGQLHISSDNWAEAIIHTVAAIVGMIPEGLVLLTSTAFMLATVRLARQEVLIQQLPAVETLARVDTLLLDKTGTLTTGEIRYDELVLLNDASEQKLTPILATVASRANSPTNKALTAKFSKPAGFTREIPFNSTRKWSAIEVDGVVYVIGAPEIVLANKNCCEELAKAADYASMGKRVLAMVKLSAWIDSDADLANIRVKPLALIILSESVRSDAAKTLKYFAKQGVEVKIISGDSPNTVSAVARQVGLDVHVYDACKLPVADKNADEFIEIVKTNNVFGRVKPEQKRQIVAALQANGHVVAMTGDGVNDALALKKSELGIAMSSGAPATRSVAEVVLMDNKFSHLPAVLSEGRRVVANIERVSNLFIIKNIYVAVLALATTALGLTYPFMPAQMTVINGLTIGFPAFFLALAPNDEKYRPGFLKRVLRFSIPTGVITALAMIVGYYLINRNGMTLEVAGTSVSIIAMIIGLAVLVKLAKPVKGWKLLLIAVCGGLFAVYITFPPLGQLFGLSLDISTLPMVFIVSAVAIVLINLAAHDEQQKRTML